MVVGSKGLNGGIKFAQHIIRNPDGIDSTPNIKPKTGNLPPWRVRGSYNSVTGSGAMNRTCLLSVK